jgi:hypothetical protein
MSPNAQMPSKRIHEEMTACTSGVRRKAGHKRLFKIKRQNFSNSTEDMSKGYNFEYKSTRFEN